MHIHNKTTHTKGIVSGWEEAIHFRDMITPSAKERARILTFWEKHGDTATKEAFHASRATLFRWQSMLDAGGGKLDALNPRSTAPVRKRMRIIHTSIRNLIIKERSMEHVHHTRVVDSSLK